MVAITSDCVVYEQDVGFGRLDSSPLGYKEILVETPDTADATNTILLTLADYGITSIKSITQNLHSTNYSVLTTGTASATSVTAGVLTITLPTGVSNEKYTFLIGGY